MTDHITLPRSVVEQAKMALEFFDDYVQPLTDKFGGPKVPEPASTAWHVHAAIAALRAALAAQQAESVKAVAWIYTSKLAGHQVFLTQYASDLTTYKADKVTPLYTAPQPAQPVAVPEMHDAMCTALDGGSCNCSESPISFDKAWARFCGEIGRGKDAPYPGMIEAFEAHYGQSFCDKDWRSETGVWAAAWKAAMLNAAPTPPAATVPVPVLEPLTVIAEKLRRAGATVPAPESGGTIESAMRTGLSIALALVEGEIQAAHNAKLAKRNAR